MNNCTFNPVFTLNLVLFLGFGFLNAQTKTNNPDLVDKKANSETKALYSNLKMLSKKGILFGHQDDLAYGIGWEAENGRSDVKEVCGSYPAVYGWDIAGLGTGKNIDGVDFDNMRNWIKDGFKRGGISTISWHTENPLTGGNAWDTTSAVRAIIPGGEKHDFYKKQLDLVADFFASLKSDKTNIPIIFRPFHEHSGAWFWWGKTHCTPEEFIKLWKFTVEYLRDVKGLHHILYAFSTDVFKTKEDYLHFYPGDDYVDILAYDDYQGVRSAESSKELVKRLEIINKLAKEKNKIAALSETGLESIPLENWWTEILLKSFKELAADNHFAWVLVWRNANTKHHYAPYTGHSSAEDFIKFEKDSYTFFEKDLPNVYKLPKKK